jgi:hypothetical protein
MVIVGALAAVAHVSIEMSSFQAKPGLPQKPPAGKQSPIPVSMKIRPPKTDGWQKSSLSAESLAANIDSAQKKAASLKGEYRLMLDSPDGRGINSGQFLIPQPGKFRVMASYYPRRASEITVEIFVANEGRFGMASRGGWQFLRPYDQRPNLLNRPIQARWAQQMARVAVAGFVTKERAFTALVQDMRRANYAIASEQRNVTAGGISAMIYRVVAGPAGKAPEIEFVTTEKTWSVLTVRASQATPKGRITAAWTARWATGRPEDFPANKFEIPKK